VTYFLEREDDTWVAISLRLLGQGEDGSWTLQADFKSALVENVVALRIDPSAPAGELDFELLDARTTRGVAESPFDQPAAHLPLVRTLLSVRRSPAAAEALLGEPNEVELPCEIRRVHQLATPGFGYQKHYDLHPLVMLTGIARLSTDGGKNPMTVTSFGSANPERAATSGDFVDLSRPAITQHEGFELSYPATWFLREEKLEDGPADVAEYRAFAGGNSCSAALSVRVSEGEGESVAEEHRATLERFATPQPDSTGRLRVRKSPGVSLQGDAAAIVADVESPGIDGALYIGIYRAEASDRMARVTAYGCIRKESPRRSRTLEQMENLFEQALCSFRLLQRPNPDEP
jgi:hypothetical protein